MDHRPTRTAWSVGHAAAVPVWRGGGAQVAGWHGNASAQSEPLDAAGRLS